MSTIKFVDSLPGRNNNRFDWCAIRDALRANPGCWAELARFDKKEKAQNSRVGLASRYPDIQGAVRQVDGQYVLFGRAVGE